MMTTNEANSPFYLDDLRERANLEGDLLVIAAHEKLGIGIQPDEDGFTNNIYAIGFLAEDFALKCGGNSPRFTHPSCGALVEEVVTLARSITEGAWDYFFKCGMARAIEMEEGW
ncbi:hypothetical protein ACIOG3_15885 [Yersinia rochesterensis]|uniref:hypothetical protein n=1 Tax=Yersinia rochesterensis TaxID=1604335 RepID=UPI0004F8EED5|nr:hypothetical protein [Yersinia rochesterensis]AIN20331.1 hypothetical protein DJ57_157 [Yersinia rochesterensis]